MGPRGGVGIRSTLVGDLDGDGDLDIIRASGDNVHWHENINGRGTFSSEQTITSGHGDDRGEIPLAAHDFDDDGDLDVAIRKRRGGIVWFENTNGADGFGPPRTISDETRGNSIVGGDLDADGDIDLLVAGGWFPNVDGRGNFGPFQSVQDAPELSPSDVDGDGDLDVLYGWEEPGGSLAWRENTDGLGTFGPEQIISTAVNNALSVHPGDIDGDGDVDVVSASEYDNKIAWYPNVDGSGAFGDQQIIAKNPTGTQSMAAADVDGDGDMDAISASILDKRIVWYQNVEGTYDAAPKTIDVEPVGAPFEGHIEVRTADLDGDHDNEIVVTWRIQFHGSDDNGETPRESALVWYENVDGRGTFGERQDVATFFFNEVSILDMDKDGDLDLLGSQQGIATWYENTDGEETFANSVQIADRFIHSAHGADLDGDGDADAVVGGLELLDCLARKRWNRFIQ